jgi:hypothetical protein
MDKHQESKKKEERNTNRRMDQRLLRLHANEYVKTRFSSCNGNPCFFTLHTRPQAALLRNSATLASL